MNTVKEFFIPLLISKYKKGISLFDIYEELKKNIRDNAQIVFHEFIKSQKNNKGLMKEFNSTSFNLSYF